MNPVKHHYIPIFYLKRWISLSNKVCVFLKNKPEVFFEAHPKDICFEKNLYTLRGNRQFIEYDFFWNIDNNAAVAINILLNNGTLSLDSKLKENISLFLLTLNLRSPLSIWEFRNYSKIQNALKEYKETGDRISPFLKIPDLKNTPIDDSPYSILIHYKNDVELEKIINARWILINNYTKHQFLTCDNPLHIISFSGEKLNSYALPKIFSMTIPLSPQKMLLITNTRDSDEFIERKINKNIRNVNDVIISRAKKFIISKSFSSKQFVLNRNK